MMLGIDVGAPPLPATETRLEFIRRYTEDSGKRLEALRAKLAGLRERTVLSTNAASYADGLHPGHPGGGMVWGVIERPPGHRMLGIGIGGPAERLAANLDAYSAALRQELAAIACHPQPGA